MTTSFSRCRRVATAGLETELVTVNTSEGAAYGAALLAGVGAGIWADVPAACADCLQVTGTTRPDEGRAEVYRAAYSIYRDLYPALKRAFDQMAS